MLAPTAFALNTVREQQKNGVKNVSARVNAIVVEHARRPMTVRRT